MHVRRCPKCDEEYRPEITTCADCGATLVDRYEDDDPGAGQNREGRIALSAKTADLLAGDPVLLLAREGAREIEPFAERLGQAGIPFRVTVDSTRYNRFELRVGSQQVEEAVRQLGDLLPAEDGPTPDTGEDPGLATSPSPCPACGTELAPGALECPDCGLAFSTFACKVCGSTLTAEQKICNGCGRQVPD